MFDHREGTLNIKVYTDDLENESAHSAHKDPNQLSGGEKSFSTCALLMSLWESVGCPIRYLDEVSSSSILFGRPFSSQRANLSVFLPV